MTQWPEGANSQSTTFGGLTRSQLMSRVRSRGNKTTELRAIRLFRLHGIIGWRRHISLIGRPDFVWSKCKVALFLDGCFWHGHQCGRNLTPKTNAELWRQKIMKNKNRDRRHDRELKHIGWKVVRIWECSLTKNERRCVDRLKGALDTSKS
jgi:DNA mismatch endonuclease, patch repair protein